MKVAWLMLLVFFSLKLFAVENQRNINYYMGQGVYSHLGKTFEDLLQFKRQDYAPTYLYTLSYSQMIYDVSRHFTMGYEFDIGKHSGIQENGEIGVMWLFGFPGLLPDNGFLDFDIVYGMGVSEAIGKPVFEGGPSDDLSKRYNFQSFLIFDFDFYLLKYPQAHLFCRIHHRSGAWGIFTEEKVTSNFIGFGMKWLF